MPSGRAKTILNRQLKKLGLSTTEAPSDLAVWTALIEKVEQTYAEWDESRVSSENVLEVSLREMERLQVEFSESNQRKIQDINEYLTLILSASDLGTWDWDLTSGHVTFDTRWIEMLGLSKDQIAPHIDAFKALVHPNDVARVELAIRNCLKHQTQKYEIYFQMKHADGRWVDILAKGKVMSYNSTHQPLRFMGTHLDVSDEKRMQRELEQQRAKLIHTSKLASMGEMSAGIAHEINNPLAIISGATGLLLKSPYDQEKLNIKLESISKACTRIAKIVSGLKKFSRSDQAPNFKTHTLLEIVKESMLLAESKSKQFSTPLSFDETCDADIFCDEVGIEQVLVNLIHNAIDAVKLKEERWVKLSIAVEANTVVLRVMDSGDGISPVIESKLFDPFFTTKIIGEGTGLGLSISKGILDEHKATIAVVHSMPNTCFEIRFPLASAQPLKVA